LPREQISDASIESSIVPLAAAMPGRRPAANLSVTGAAIEAAAAVHRPPESTAVFGSPTQDGMPRLLPGTPSSLDRDAASAVLVRPTDSGGAPTSSGQAGAPASQTGLMAATQPLPSLHNTAGVPEIQPGPAIAAPLQAAPNNIHAAVPATEQVAPHVGTTGWDQAVGQKVVWMVAGAQSSASLTLNPPNLGPLQVALSVVNNQTVISFTAAQPEVRHALEAAMPKLREMLDNVGIQMGETSVSAGAPQQHGKNGEPDHAPRRFGQTNADINVSPPAISNRPADGKEGMIDTFV
jgi:flagellar hook-length control protein FliK